MTKLNKLRKVFHGQKIELVKKEFKMNITVNAVRGSKMLKPKIVRIDLEKGATIPQLKQFMNAKGPHGIKVLHPPMLKFKGRQYTTYGDFSVTKTNQYINLIDVKTGERKVGQLRKWKIVGCRV